jgi:hypothetical protein
MDQYTAANNEEKQAWECLWALIYRCRRVSELFCKGFTTVVQGFQNCSATSSETGWPKPTEHFYFLSPACGLAQGGPAAQKDSRDCSSPFQAL